MPAGGRGRAAAAAAVLAVVLSLCASVEAAAPKYDLLVLRQDWSPTSCAGGVCSAQPFGAFTIYELLASNVNSPDPNQQGNCTGPAFYRSQIPEVVKEELYCIYSDGTRTEQLWKDLWDSQGVCSGLSVADFFTRVVATYHRYNANIALSSGGISLEESQDVSRDAILRALKDSWGKDAWLLCDPGSDGIKMLKYVQACFQPPDLSSSDPWNLVIVDCPWNASDPESPGGADCAGQLRMERGVAPTPECDRFFPAKIPGAFFPSSPPPQPFSSPPPATIPSPAPSPAAAAAPSPALAESPSSPLPAAGSPGESTNGGSSAAVIAGAAVGGLLAAGLASGAFLLVRRRRALRRSVNGAGAGPPDGKQAQQLSAAAGGPGGAAAAPFPLKPRSDPPSLSVLPSPASNLEQAWLTPSYLSSVGTASPPVRCSADGSSSSAGLLPPSSYTRQSLSIDSLETDPFLSRIATILTTTAHSRRQQRHTGSPTAAADWQLCQPERSQLSASSAGARLSVEVAQWVVQWEQLRLEQLIGTGAFGRVYRAQWNGTPIAVKLLVPASDMESLQSLELPDEVMRALQEEAGVMARIRHPFVASFLGVCTLPPCLLTELCTRGSLYDVLHQAARQPRSELAEALTWRRRVGMAYDAARGLLYLHARDPPILHRDVKSPNLLCDEHFRVKVCDFNLAELLKQQPGAGHETDTALAVTNPMWLSPEVRPTWCQLGIKALRGEKATWASDVFSFGLVLLELLTWQLPWVGAASPFQIRRMVLEGKRPAVPPLEELPGPARPPPGAFAAYCQLMRECWSAEPAERPPFAGIVRRLGDLQET